ncbi:MAG: PAS domain S-box protein [Candidatus Didemnitutus sp.]|nr:PAS domain S-box protein [Candidatus Didemnitutus sp.]
MKSNFTTWPVRIAAFYALGATAWIVASNWSFHLWAGTMPEWTVAEIYKDFLFVMVTTGLLLGLLNRSRTALRQQELSWRRALDATGDGGWEYDIATGNFTFSPRWRELLGYAEEDVGSDDWSSWIHSDDRARVQEERQKCLQGMTSIYRSEYRIRAKDGGYRWVLSRGKVITSPKNGRPMQLVGTHTDLTSRKTSEAKLAEAAGRYDVMFESNPSPMWVYDVTTRTVLVVNNAALMKYDYTRATFLQLTMADLEAPAEGSGWEAHERNAPPETRTSGPWRHRCANGTLLLVEITSHAINWEGRPARFLMAHDVTATIAARQALEDSELKLRSIYQESRDAILLIDERDCVADGNPQALALFRATLTDLVGRGIWELAPPMQPDGTSSHAKAIQYTSSARTSPLAPFECRMRRLDGVEFDATISFGLIHRQTVDEVIMIVRDITEQKLVKQRLDLMHAALQATPAAWVITNHAGMIEWANPSFSRITGYAVEDVIGQHTRILSSGRHAPEFYANLWQTVLRGEVWEGDLHNRRKDGTLYHEHMVIAPVRNAQGETTHFVAMKHDITAERQLEQQLVRAQQLESIGMLASGIAHDLNNVLAPILMAVELLKSDAPTPEMQSRLNLIGQAAVRGAGIVKHVLMFARGADGERTVVQLRYLVREVADLIRETIPRDIEVSVTTGRVVSPVMGDVTRLHQVLLNLSINARDAMPQGGRLALSVRDTEVDEAQARLLPPLTPGGYVEITVSDTGTGITDEVMEHLFDPFFTTKERGKGTGLGLATVYGIVRSHSGVIDVSTKMGVGSTFRVLLPRLMQSPATQPSEASKPKLDGAGRLVLVVDDEAPIRNLFEVMLRRYGFRVVIASDGVEALQLFALRPQSFALAITDMMMPRMGGAALIEVLRKSVPGLPVISCSGLATVPENEGQPDVGRAGGAVTVFLAKPFTEIELFAAVQLTLAPEPNSALAKKNV